MVRISMRYGTWLSTAKLDIQAQFPRLILYFFQNLECFALALSRLPDVSNVQCWVDPLTRLQQIQAFATLMPSHHSLHSPVPRNSGRPSLYRASVFFFCAIYEGTVIPNWLTHAR